VTVPKVFAWCATGACRAWASVFFTVGLILLGMTLVLGWMRPAGVRGAAAFEPMTALETAAFFSFVLLGSLLVLRRPTHPIGWLLAGLGLSVLMSSATQEYALRSQATAGGLWAGQVAAWVSYWATAPALIAFIEMLLLFPNGHPPSSRWRWLVKAVAGAGLVMTVSWAVASWPLRGLGWIVPALPFSGALAFLPVVNYAVFACLPVAAGSLIWRFRSATGDERQQLKWLALAAGGLVIAATASVASDALGRNPWLIDAAVIVCIAGVAAAVALAILRYRLYEIDRILSRTLSYGLLTALLVGIYGLVVVVAGAVLEPFFSDSTAAVAVSTLAVAALFTPLRRRIQTAVDHRFNRARYDAERTVTAFHTRLRAEVRLDTLAADLLSTVEQTVQPVRASVWLRPLRAGQRATSGVP